MALSSAHTVRLASRFNPGRPAVPAFVVLYLSELPTTAQFEIEALYGNPMEPPSFLPNPRRAWTALPVTFQLHSVVDLTDLGSQRRLETTVQELTGDWRGYEWRSNKTRVSEPNGIAPTQKLGLKLFAEPDVEGFLYVSARVPFELNLAIFPTKLSVGSSIGMLDPSNNDVVVVDGGRQR